MMSESRSRVGRQLNSDVVRSSGYIIAACGFMLCVTVFYPGYMSPDSVDQLNQARMWNFSDIHPPMMSAIWSVADKIIAGPFGMLLLHNAIFWGAAALFWRATWRTSVLLGLSLTLFPFMPQVLALLSSIWKDIGLGAALFMASALLYTSRQANSKLSLFAALPFLAYGYSVRWNAAPALLPLCLWAGMIACRALPFLERRARGLKIMPVVCGVFLFLCLSGVVLVSTRVLTGGRTMYPSQQVMLYDLAAISLARGESLFPRYISERENFSLQLISERYNSGWVNQLIYAEPVPLIISVNAADISDLRASWRQAVAGNKLAYLKHRWNVFSTLLGFNTVDVWMSFNPSDGYNPREYRRPRGSVNRALTSYFFCFSNSLLFRGFFCFLIFAGLIYFSLRSKIRGDMEFVCVLSMSGLLYIVAYFFVTPSSEYRYLWWSVLAACVSLLFFIRQAVAFRRSFPHNEFATQVDGH